MVHSIIDKMTDYVTSPSFQSRYVKLPTTGTPLPPRLLESPKFFPWFEHALGAIDGSHIHASPSAEERASSCNRKGNLSQNLLAACTFHMIFCYINSGWEGSASDSQIFDSSRSNRSVVVCPLLERSSLHICSLKVPDGYYYLADAGFAHSRALLVPYRGARYHLCEWAQGNSK
jgi:hypothetical protein